VQEPSTPTVSVEPRVATHRLVRWLLGALLLSFSSLPAQLGRPGAFVAELVLVVLGALLALRAARPYLAASGERTMLRVLVALVTLIAVGQIARSKKLFPLMPYTMYGRAAQGDATFYEYQALHRSGARERFRPSKVIATLGRARIVKGLARELDVIREREAKGADASSERARFGDTMAALVAYQNRAHERDPITQVEVVQVVLPAPYFASSARRHTLFSLPFEAAP
jgi:hypothetical protein